MIHKAGLAMVQGGLRLAGVAVFAACGAIAPAPAQAADLGRMVAKAPPAAAPALPSWTGFYVGGNAGYVWGQSDGDYQGALPPLPPAPPPTPAIIAYPFGLNPQGAALGAQLGYNVQFGLWVLGLEGDWSWLFNADDTIFDPAGTPRYDQIELLWTGHARGRIGYLFGNTLVYFAGGAAFASTRNTHYGPVGGGGTSWYDTRLRTGYSLGGGFEHMLSPNWLLRLEYLFDKFDSENFTWAAGRYTRSDLTLSTLRIGLSWRPGP